jgi:hypothetical protein
VISCGSPYFAAEGPCRDVVKRPSCFLMRIERGARICSIELIRRELELAPEVRAPSREDFEHLQRRQSDWSLAALAVRRARRLRPFLEGLLGGEADAMKVSDDAVEIAQRAAETGGDIHFFPSVPQATAAVIRGAAEGALTIVKSLEQRLAAVKEDRKAAMVVGRALAAAKLAYGATLIALPGDQLEGALTTLTQDISDIFDSDELARYDSADRRDYEWLWLLGNAAQTPKKFFERPLWPAD